MKTAARLTGKKKLVALTPQMESGIRSYCRDRNIESESELIRQAIVKFIDSGYDDDTLKLSALKDVREGVSRLHDMVSVIFSYLHMMHLNLLAYHPEIAGELKEAAIASAKNRQEKFFAAFQDGIGDNPAFFEKLLHDFVTGSLDGKG